MQSSRTRGRQDGVAGREAGGESRTAPQGRTAAEVPQTAKDHGRHHHKTAAANGRYAERVKVVTGFRRTIRFLKCTMKLLSHAFECTTMFVNNT